MSKGSYSKPFGPEMCFSQNGMKREWREEAGIWILIQLCNYRGIYLGGKSSFSFLVCEMEGLYGIYGSQLQVVLAPAVIHRSCLGGNRAFQGSQPTAPLPLSLSSAISLQFFLSLVISPELGITALNCFSSSCFFPAHARTLQMYFI